MLCRCALDAVAGLCSVALLWSVPWPAAQAATCLYVSSYHQGYEWNDGIERGIERALAGKCELKKFYMDTKRHDEPSFGMEMALKAKQYIETLKPDVVIACDDPASAYLVRPYYKDAELPIVFCGINQSVTPYGYPYRNVTGMIEISPIKPLLKEIKSTLKRVKRGVYLAPDSMSQHREFELNRETYAQEGIEITPIFVKNMIQWEAGYEKAQAADFLIIGNNGGIEDWDNARAAAIAAKHTRKLSVTNYDWMVDYAILAMTKLAEEQGEWAALSALSILNGSKPAQLPIVTNRKWNIYVNLTLLGRTDVELSPRIIHKAVKIGESDR
ncbi:MAG: ABC transporter substrate binding protein [Pseudomonadota bacterium]